jgi:hypothetical protein
MAERQATEAPQPPVAPATLAEALDALQRVGAGRVDPVRLRYLEVLARRIASSQPAMQQQLLGRWRADCALLEERCLRTAPSGGVVDAPRGRPGAATPLADLNHYLRSASRAAAGASPHALPGDDASELRSLRDFRETWSRIAAVDQVDAAVTRGPENAGPLNSHSLVLRSLALMRSLSPDYLRRFLSQMETLMALEQATERQREPVAKAKPKAARKKR